MADKFVEVFESFSEGVVPTKGEFAGGGSFSAKAGLVSPLGKKIRVD